MHEVAKYKLQLQMIRGAVKIELEKRRIEVRVPLELPWSTGASSDCRMCRRVGE